MARYTGPKCRLCRREGAKLFLKGTRCESPKCAAESGRRDFPPGMRTWRRGKPSDYALQLREKQKVKRYYGILDRQFRKYFKEAESRRGNTGENLLVALERRLDNVVTRLGLGKSRSEGRQLVCHGHVNVNGRRVDIPSFLVSIGDVVSVRDDADIRKVVAANLEVTGDREMPGWLERDAKTLSGKVAKLPTRDEVAILVSEQLIVEFMSK